MRKKIEVKDKRELAERLMRGERIVTGDGKRLVFDMTTARSPFRYTREGGGHGPMVSAWNRLDDLYIEVPWQENIGKGKLCWAWDIDRNSAVIRMVTALDKASSYPYRAESCTGYKNAEPMTPEEIAEYTVQNL